MPPAMPGRPLGSPPAPRRRFLAPAGVRIAQVVVVLRIGATLALVFSAGGAVVPHVLSLSAGLEIPLPGGVTWVSIAPLVVASSLVEAALLLGLGRLRRGSRRLIITSESLVIAAGILYAAAGARGPLLLIVPAIAAVELLRVDEVRHCFARAAAIRRFGALGVDGALLGDEPLPDAGAAGRRQLVGYRVNVAAVEASIPDRVSA